MTDFYSKSSAELKKLALEIERETVATIREYYPVAPTVLVEALAFIHEEEEEIAYVANEYDDLATVLATEHYKYPCQAEHMIRWLLSGADKVRADVQRALVNLVDQLLNRHYLERFNKWVSDLLRRGYNTARISTLLRLVDELVKAYRDPYYYGLYLVVDGYRVPEIELAEFDTSAYDKYRTFISEAFTIS